MDCSVLPLRQKGLFMISTTDFFFPNVDDPYLQGMIGAANVLSDMYAMGVVEVDNVLMQLAASLDINKPERDIVTRLMMKGFRDQVHLAGSQVTGGQSVQNPWPIIGGTAMSICSKEEYVDPDGAQVGDVLVLTKPLGTQVASNLNQWRYLDDKWALRAEGVVTKEEADEAYETAIDGMSRLNRNGARLMLKYKAHGATDVTGFGLLGHSKNLAKNQTRPLQFKIHTLPIIKHMDTIDKKNQLYNLLQGRSAETSGGLLICLAKDVAEAFCKELEELDGKPAWIIGEVLPSDSEDPANNTSIIDDQPRVISV
eukprot:TRINITY_DN6767_c0_g1_i2.p1 TRINITY_DN6767_c0_g1~~TRINITY_DN6767_c0_g1_i2.p1  ORF type:complete len:312 (+),score=76.96 TRINITY_DN6767_c0_g1_i2:301-1236(+)